MFVFPVDHGCTGFGSHQESEFEWLFLDQLFTLIIMMEFVFFCSGPQLWQCGNNRCKNIIFWARLSLILSQQRTIAEKTKLTIVRSVKRWSRNFHSNSLSWWDPKPVLPWPTGKANIFLLLCFSLKLALLSHSVELRFLSKKWVWMTVSRSAFYAENDGQLDCFLLWSAVEIISRKVLLKIYFCSGFFPHCHNCGPS